MTNCYNDYEENKLSSCAHLRKVGGFKYSSAQIRAGRICCSKDTPRFCGESHKTTTPTSSTKNEQTENTFYAFSYYQITGQDRNCNCYICSDLDEFKPKKQNNAAAAIVGFAAAKKQPKRRAYA